MSGPTNDVDVLSTWLARFSAAVEGDDIDGAVELFHDDSYWRDLVAFSWSIVTVEGRDGVSHLLRDTLARVRPHSFEQADDMPALPPRPGVVQGWIRFGTSVGSCVGLVRLVAGKASTFLTALREIRGHEEFVRHRRPWGADHGARTNRRSWAESLQLERSELGYSTHPDVLIVGGSQGGLGLAARFRQLGVSTIVVDRREKAGDTWRSRYESLCLHDPVWFDHLPYLQFPENWPVYTPKDKLAGWLDLYVSAMEINFWGSTTCTQAVWNERSRRWSVTLDRGGLTTVVHPAHLVLATGLNGKPAQPVFAGADSFAGDQHHSSDHPGPEPFIGKRVVVVGANNSAHDIAAALWEAGVDVTMLQRSSTLVVKADTFRERSLAALYSERAVAAGMSADDADLVQASTPYKLLPELQIPLWDDIRDADADFYADLERAGFALDFGEDGSGLSMKFLTRGGGYYIDVGASGLIADGSIKLRSGVGVERLDADGVVLTTGEHIPADVVVYATGFSPAQDTVADIVSPAVADRIGPIWGLGSGRSKDPGPWVGELRNMWRPTAQEGLWIHGGNLQQSRSYSLYLALQIKARLVGLDTPVFDSSHE